WIEVTFDCEAGRKEAIDKIEKKSRDWFRMIPEEKEEEEEKRRPNGDNEDENLKYIILWDLPKDINQQEIQYACKKIGTVENIQIKRSFTKARAILKINREREAEVPWTIPIGDEKLARITESIEDFDERNRRSKIIARLRSLPKGASEVLEWKTQYNSDRDNQDRSERSQSREKEERVIDTKRKREEEEFSEKSEYEESEAKELNETLKQDEESLDAPERRHC
ncbi:5632_t:CDS:2, partial [Ambispora leptoticha]